MWDWGVYGLGCLGGVVAYGFAFVLPEFRHLAEKGETRAEFTGKRILGYVGLLGFYVLLAGGAAVWLDDGSTNWKQAVAFGMSWEVVAKGLGSQVRRTYLAALYSPN